MKSAFHTIPLDDDVIIPKSKPITTSLYEIIEAVSDEVNPDEMELIGPTIWHILSSGNVTSYSSFNELRVL